jgi:hypothetical protein
MTKSIGNGVVARRGNARITHQQFAKWAPRIPQDVRHFITTDPNKLGAAGRASVMLLVYEHEKVLSPATGHMSITRCGTRKRRGAGCGRSSGTRP